VTTSLSETRFDLPRFTGFGGDRSRLRPARSLETAGMPEKANAIRTELDG
jgi:hypothetical protein